MDSIIGTGPRTAIMCLLNMHVLAGSQSAGVEHNKKSKRPNPCIVQIASILRHKSRVISSIVGNLAVVNRRNWCLTRHVYPNIQ